MNQPIKSSQRPFDACPSRILGLDVGDARIGVALSDPTLLLASPFGIVSRKDGQPAERIAQIVLDNDVNSVVIGIPKNMDGSEGPQARKVQKFAGQLSQLIPDVPIAYWDERRTTFEAHAIRRESGMNKKNRAKPVDDAAAAIILQNYLDFLRQKR